MEKRNNITYLKSKPSIDTMKNFYGEPTLDKNRDRPYVWYMFVMSADGIGSMKEKEYPDKEIGLSGPGIALAHKKHDDKKSSGAYTDFRMLQYGWAVADAVIAGSGIIKAEKDLTWMPSDEDLLKLRTDYGKPLRVLITGNGFNANELEYDVFNSTAIKTLIATSNQGYIKMQDAIKTMPEIKRPTAEIKTFGEKSVDMEKLLKTLKKDYGINTVDLQGGPNIAGQFFKKNLVDEYRLTLSPSIVGSLSSKGEIRPTPVKTSFLPDDLEAMTLKSLGISNNHLLLRYMLDK